MFMESAKIFLTDLKNSLSDIIGVILNDVE